MKNEELKTIYNDMHERGPSAWFSDGKEERELILKMGEPWKGLDVLEIGCGEGELVEGMANKGSYVYGIDYSDEAIKNALIKRGVRTNGPIGQYTFHVNDYRNCSFNGSRIVMQGVIEHLDDPFTELKWMMDNLLTEAGDVITSSPCFLNPRGIVWMTLNMVGAMMSKTDLHYLNPWDFERFAGENGYRITTNFCDDSWGTGPDMISDLRQRIPLALPSTNSRKIEGLLTWLSLASSRMISLGASAVYRITK